MLIVSQKLNNPAYAATTAFVQNNEWSSETPEVNWPREQISLSNEYGVRKKETVAHELGHAFGLSHRISDSTSLMYFEGAPDGVYSPQTLDRDVLNHIYGY